MILIPKARVVVLSRIVVCKEAAAIHATEQRFEQNVPYYVPLAGQQHKFTTRAAALLKSRRRRRA